MKLIFEWDARKAQTDHKKHKVSLEGGKTVFQDPFLITFPDEAHSADEERFLSMGASCTGRILLVAHTEQAEGEGTLIIRIISCRKATSAERKTYEEEPM